MDDDIKKIDEEIEDLKNRGKHEHIEEEETEEETDTKQFDMDNYDEEEVEEEDTKEIEEVHETREERLEKKEEELKEIEEEKKEEKPKKKKKKWPFIVGGIILLLIIILVVVFLLLNGTKKGIDTDTEKKLTKKEQKEIIKGYGEAVEGIIGVYYTNQHVLLEFGDAEKLVKYDHKVKCSIHEVYQDGKIYLNKCKIDGKSTKYSYGEEQKEPEFNEETSFKVYVDEKNNKASLEKIEGAKEYIVNAGGKFSEPTLLDKKGALTYVVWFDEQYNTHMVDYTQGKEVLTNISYTSINPIKTNSGYTKYAAVRIGDKYAIYNYVTGDKITSTIYDSIRSYFGMGVSGPSIGIPTLGDTYNIITYKNGVNSVIDCTNGKSIIKDYMILLVSGDYIIAAASYEDNNRDIYDFDGKQYFVNKYDVIYDIVEGKYMLVNKDNHILLVGTNGSILHDFGEDKGMGSYNFGLKYNDGVLFQIAKDENSGDCFELIYSKANGSEKKSVTCGGIAKPILYLYPKKTTNVIVTFEHPEYLETTYPKFINSWNVKAKSNGDLYDKNDKYYYGLYWDEKKVHSVDFSTGFYVEDKDAIDFLEEKLEYIGLNDKERNEFITYWLPIMEKNKKNLVYFELTEEREGYNKINISPKPNTLLRVVIHIKKVDKKTDIKKESLTHTARRGFVAVEWGGTTY